MRQEGHQQRTALRAAWQQVCFAEPRSRIPTSGAANPAQPQGGRSALGSEARELSDEAKRLGIPTASNFTGEDAQSLRPRRDGMMDFGSEADPNKHGFQKFFAWLWICAAIGLV